MAASVTTTPVISFIGLKCHRQASEDPAAVEVRRLLGGLCFINDTHTPQLYRGGKRLKTLPHREIVTLGSSRYSLLTSVSLLGFLTWKRCFPPPPPPTLVWEGALLLPKPRAFHIPYP